MGQQLVPGACAAALDQLHVWQLRRHVLCLAQLLQQVAGLAIGVWAGGPERPLSRKGHRNRKRRAKCAAAWGTRTRLPCPTGR